LHTEQYDPAADRRKMEQCAEWCEKFSPIVGLEPCDKPAEGDSLQPESLLLDVSGLGPLFGGEEALLRKIVAEFARQGYQARAAVADSLGAAWAVARFATASRGDSPATTWIVPTGQSETALAPLPLAALRIPAAAIALLQQLGIQEVGQLLRLPRVSLTSRFGDRLILRIDQALGRAREVIVAHRPQPTFQAEWLLEYPTAQRELVELITRQLIERVSHLLVDQNRGAVRLEICLRCVAEEEIVDSALGPPIPCESGDGSATRHGVFPTRRFPPLLFRVGLFRPTAVPRHLWDLAQLQFEQTQWPGPVERIAVTATLTAPLEVRQGQLFDDGVRDGQRQLAILIERLSNRLGMECVLQPRIVADAQPDRACRYVPLTGRLNTLSVRPGKDSDDEKRQLRFRALDRPLFLQHPPLPLQILTAVNQKPPARFRDERHWHAVIRYWGPERIETGWWRGTSVRRDYYRVETESGLWFWIFCQLNDGRWYLHGKYE
jgi:protein ImuB